MATCPNCNRIWQWDWENDVYRLPDLVDISANGIPCIETALDKGTEYRCLCGQVLGIMLSGGGELVNQPEGWDELDWEHYEHYWDG